MLSIVAFLVIAPMATGSSANAATFSFTQIDVPGASSTQAFGINDAGQIVGGFADSTGGHGFLFTGGSFTQIDVPGASVTQAQGINDAGQIVGAFNDSTGAFHGFLDTGGSFTPIDVPGASSTQAFGINDAGQIVGSFFDPSTGGHGFFTTNTGGSFTQIDVPGALRTQALDINDAGQIVGFFDAREDLGFSTHGFLDTGGSFTQIDVPGAGFTVAFGINDAGQIVGFFTDRTGCPPILLDVITASSPTTPAAASPQSTCRAQSLRRLSASTTWGRSSVGLKTARVLLTASWLPPQPPLSQSHPPLSFSASVSA